MKFVQGYTIKEIAEMDQKELLRERQKKIHEDLKDEVEREWVGLTKEELQNLCVKSYQTDNAGETHFNRGFFADAIEAKLKEKNA